MKILNLHGCQEQRHNSAYEALIANGCAVKSLSMDYDAESPRRIRNRLRKIIKAYHIEVIVGSGLGGFYAAVLSAELYLPVILVDPVLLPFLMLSEHTEDYVALFGTLSALERRKVSCIIGERSDCVRLLGFVRNLLMNRRFCIVPEGEYSNGTMPLKAYFAEVLQYYSTILPH